MSKGPPDPRSFEKMSQDIARHLEGKEFSSDEELNRYLKGALDQGKPPEFEPQTPEEIAQNMMYDSWEISNRKKRIKIAYKALGVSPDWPMLILHSLRTKLERLSKWLNSIKKQLMRERGHWGRKYSRRTQATSGERLERGRTCARVRPSRKHFGKWASMMKLLPIIARCSNSIGEIIKAYAMCSRPVLGNSESGMSWTVL